MTSQEPGPDETPAVPEGLPEDSAALAGVPEEGAGVDFGALLAQFGQVQQGLQDAQASAAAQVVEGSAGGGMVRVALTGDLEVQSVVIDPSVVDPAEVEMLQDLVLAAVRDALDKTAQLQQQALGGLGGLLGGFADS